MAETAQARLKRLYMRSIRRGIKEMDIILGNFAETHLPGLDETGIQSYDRLLSENDHDLYAWVTGAAAPIPEFESIIAEIQATLPKPNAS